MFEGEEEDKELLERLMQIICGDKMIGAEAAALMMKRDAERYRLARAQRLIDLRDEERLDEALGKLQ